INVRYSCLILITRFGFSFEIYIARTVEIAHTVADAANTPQCRNLDAVFVDFTREFRRCHVGGLGLAEFGQPVLHHSSHQEEPSFPDPVPQEASSLDREVEYIAG